VICNAAVEVLPTKRVTGGSEHLKHAIINQQERNIERATTEAVRDNLQAPLLSRLYAMAAAVSSFDGMKDN